ncbi:MAG: UDP-N-acetylglucosamine 1-carboxyvinyltransferase, partial [Microgenomates group bacterium]
MEKFLITGGIPLKGEVGLCGAKNSGFKLMIASLYSKEPCIIHNFSKIGDVETTAEMIRELGGKVIFRQNHNLEVSAMDLKNNTLSREMSSFSRASTYFAGPLLYHFGEAILPIPGGCKIGRRPIDRHLEGLKTLGAKIEMKENSCRIWGKLKGATYRFPKNTHGGTDVMVIAAAGAEGKTILENAAAEPEVDDLISFLNKMGAKIKRVEQRTIVIDGVREFNPVEHSVMPDRNEAVTFACGALSTRGDIFVRQARPQFLT